MFSVIASSARVSSPSPSCNKSGHHHQTHQMNTEIEHSCEVSTAKNIQDKERETFLSYGIFNMVAGKRTAELLHKQHKHEQHRQSHPDVCGFSDLFHHAKHSNESTPNPSPKVRHQRPTHAHTIDLSEHVAVCKSQGHHQKSSKCDLSKPRDLHKHKKPEDLHSSSSMDSILYKSAVSCHKPLKWSLISCLFGTLLRQVAEIQNNVLYRYINVVWRIRKMIFQYIVLVFCFTELLHCTWRLQFLIYSRRTGGLETPENIGRGYNNL